MIIFTRRGEQGLTGPTGPAGSPGLIYSVGIPDNGTGSDGDSCVDNSKMHLYRKVAGAWVFQAAMLTAVTDDAATVERPTAGSGEIPLYNP